MKLQVIKTHKGYLVVSNYNTEISEGSWFIDEFGLRKARWYTKDKTQRLVIATDTTFKLEGIPQFELENNIELNFNYQDVDELDNKPDLQKWVDNNELEALIDESKGGIIGYIHREHIDEITGLLNKVSQQKGCYTEEDLKIMKSEFFNQFCLRTLSGTEITGDVWNWIQSHLQSLKQSKKLVAIDVEEEIYYLSYGEDTHLPRIRTKVTKSEQYPDGILTTKKYYYE